MEQDVENVKQIIPYITQRSIPFDLTSTSLINIVTGKQIDEDISNFLIECLDKGEGRYQQFRESRLQQKTVKLFEPISKLSKTRKLK